MCCDVYDTTRNVWGGLRPGTKGVQAAGPHFCERKRLEELGGGRAHCHLLRNSIILFFLSQYHQQEDVG